MNKQKLVVRIVHMFSDHFGNTQQVNMGVPNASVYWVRLHNCLILVVSSIVYWHIQYWIVYKMIFVICQYTCSGLLYFGIPNGRCIHMQGYTSDFFTCGSCLSKLEICRTEMKITFKLSIQYKVFFKNIEKVSE